MPWLGLFHKASLADKWVFEDFCQYQVKDWYNRNYIKTPNGKKFLTVPLDLRKGSIVAIKDIKISKNQKWQIEHWKTNPRRIDPRGFVAGSNSGNVS